LTPAYQFNVGDVIVTYEMSVGMIIERTNAADYMAFNHKVDDSLVHAYTNIPIYKVLLDGKITYVNESNIKDVLENGKYKKEVRRGFRRI